MALRLAQCQQSSSFVWRLAESFDNFAWPTWKRLVAIPLDVAVHGVIQAAAFAWTRYEPI
jgi:hypothetical protein